MPLPAKKESHKRTVSKFVRAHGKSLSLMGALIVFITFLVKEGFREHVKDLVDSSESGRSVFVIRADSNLLAFQLLGMERSLNAVLNTVPRREKELASLEGIDRPMTILSHMQQDIAATLDNTAGLFEKATGSTIKSEVESLRKRLDGLRDYHRSVADLINETRRGKYATVEHASHEELVKLQILDLLQRTEKLSTDAQDAAGTVLKEVDEKTRAEQKDYRVLTWASYGLYTLGWTLGLLGKAFGVELPVGE